MQDNIPIYFAANGPKALELTGEVADGWITVFSDAEYFSRDLATVARGAEKAGRSVEAIARMALTTTCLLQPGESPTSPRVIERVGPYAILSLHAMWEGSAVAVEQSPLGQLYARYRDHYIAKMQTPQDRRYLEVHEGI